MFGKNKGFKVSQSKRTSKRMESSMVGSHHANTSTAKHSRDNETAQGFLQAGISGDRMQQGYVDQLDVSASSGEDDSAYSRRIAQPGYMQKVQHRARMRHLVVAIIIIVLIIIIALAVGVITYFATSNSKLARGLDNASSALVEPTAGEPYYVLCAAELGSAGKAQGSETDAYILMRVDESTPTLTLISIPNNINVRLSDGDYHLLCDAYEVGGEAELIEQVASLASVDIAHFVFLDAEGLTGLIDRMGGVNIDVTAEIDDPYAGINVLRTGEQTLEGDSALTFLRATNLADGIEATFRNQTSFMVAFLRQALSVDTLSFTSDVGDVGDYMSTDFTSSELLTLADKFRDFDAVSIYSCSVPGSVRAGDPALFDVSENEWSELLGQVNIDGNPALFDSALASVVPSEITVEVLNGADVDGAAANMASILGDAGFVIENVGNVDDGTLYPETLVIYNDEAYLNAANAVVETAGAGRVVDGGDYYTLTTNVKVIIGQDWMPLL